MKLLKMKILSFNNIEDIKKILRGEKTQSLRLAQDKAYSLNTIIDAGYGKEADPSKIPKKVLLGATTYLDKEARFEVGEKIKLMFKQRSKYICFCSKCGAGITSRISFRADDGTWWCINCKEFVNVILKDISPAEITKVFKIEIGLMTYNYGDSKKPFSTPMFYYIKCADKNCPYREKNWFLDNSEREMWKKDGFKDDGQGFYDSLNREYSLGEPKKFWVYRFKLI